MNTPDGPEERTLADDEYYQRQCDEHDLELQRADEAYDGQDCVDQVLPHVEYTLRFIDKLFGAK